MFSKDWLQQPIDITKKKVFPPWYHIKVGTRKVMFWLFNYNQVDEMIVFIVRTDGGEELFERSLMPGW